ncbi:hypothetical protein NDU88_003939 [Pleurodeles waltl]|uniref:Reverse transcriptase domain-containing protein n=1 Tax=Pleurodeles waltl TaxID=8319 RepID=A0AAV7REJ6_PLEWA|nr:hypothetical protein NDU88_003939 [Pleurodeles waltl]
MSGAPIATVGDNIESYAKDLFLYILESIAEADIQLDRVHGVGLPSPENSRPVDILVCVQDFPPKEQPQSRQALFRTGSVTIIPRDKAKLFKRDILLLVVDAKKAFDSIRWPYLAATLALVLARGSVPGF